MDDRMLRSQLRRGPWANSSDLNSVFRELDSVSTVPGGVADDLYPAPQAQSLWTRGFANGDFSEGPPNPSSPINNTTNKLPGWSLVTVQGTSISVYWDVDTTAPGGAVIRFALAAGTLNDEVYLQQDAPIAGSPSDGRVNWPVFSITSITGTVGTAKGYAVYLKEDQSTTTGSAQTTTYTSTGRKEMALGYVVTPTDATFLRFRIGAYRNVTDSNTASIVVSESVLLRGSSRVLVADDVPASYSDVASISRSSGVMKFDPRPGTVGGSRLQLPTAYPAVRVQDVLELPLFGLAGPLSDPDGSLRPVTETGYGSGFLWAASDGSLWFRWTPDGITITDTAVGSGGTAAFSGARYYRATTQSIPDATDTNMRFNVGTGTGTQVYDTDGSTGTYHTDTNDARFVAPETGKYHVSVVAEFAASAAGQRGLYLQVNGAGDYGHDFVDNPLGGFAARLSISMDLLLTAGDYVTAVVWQNSGGALNLTSGRPNAFSIHKLGGIKGDTGPAGSLSFATVEVDLGSVPMGSGSFVISGLSGLTTGREVLVTHAAAQPTGKGTDEGEMDMILAHGVVASATTIQVYWQAVPGPVAGNFKFNYNVSST